MHLSYIDTNTISKQAEPESTWPSTPRSSIGCVQNDFWAYVMFDANRAPILHQRFRSSIKPTKTSFHLSLVSYWYHQVRPKRFLRIRYVKRKPCTYLAPTLTLSPNRKKWDSTQPLSPRSSIGCIQNDVRKPCTYLVSRLALFANGPKLAFTWASSPRSFTGWVQNNFRAYGTFEANHAPILSQD